jgi:hypothetical protein
VVGEVLVVVEVLGGVGGRGIGGEGDFFVVQAEKGDGERGGANALYLWLVGCVPSWPFYPKTATLPTQVSKRRSLKYRNISSKGGPPGVTASTCSRTGREKHLHSG